MPPSSKESSNNYSGNPSEPDITSYSEGALHISKFPPGMSSKEKEIVRKFNNDVLNSATT
jgi:hypothetical protein